MRFIFDKDGYAAINPALVKKFFIERIFAEGWEETKNFRVSAELSENEDDVILKEFISDNEEKNFQAAKIYLAELVKTLNAEK